MYAPSTPVSASPTRPRHRTDAPSSITPVAWVATGEMDLAEWTAAGRRLGAMGRCGQWGIGDWINYGNAKFGERYTRAARITGYDAQTLMNMVYVASRFDISRRRENLSWSHHETVASLTPHEQDRWLDRAAAERLSISDLRLELRQMRDTGRAHADPRARKSHQQAIVICPACGHEIHPGTDDRKD